METVGLCTPPSSNFAGSASCESYNGLEALPFFIVRHCFQLQASPRMYFTPGLQRYPFLYTWPECWELSQVLSQAPWFLINKFLASLICLAVDKATFSNPSEKCKDFRKMTGTLPIPIFCKPQVFPVEKKYSPSQFFVGTNGKKTKWSLFHKPIYCHRVSYETQIALDMRQMRYNETLLKLCNYGWWST